MNKLENKMGRPWPLSDMLGRPTTTTTWRGHTLTKL